MYAFNWGAGIAGIAQCLVRRTRDRKVAGSSPGGSDRRIFFLQSQLSALTYFGIRSTTVLPHSAKRAVGRLQINTCTRLCMKWHCKLVHACRRTCTQRRVHRDGSSSKWHQPCSNEIALYWVHHFDEYSKNALQEATVTHSYSHAKRAQWVCSGSENSVI